MKGFKIIVSAGFLASALVLAGCGGGSNDNTMSEAEKAMAMEKKEADDAIKAAIDAANALGAMANSDDVEAVEKYIGTAKTEIGDLPEADQAAAMARLASAEAIVTQAKGRLEAEAGESDAEDRADDAEDELEDLKEDAKTKEQEAAEKMARADASKLHEVLAAHFNATANVYTKPTNFKTRDGSMREVVSVDGQEFNEEYSTVKTSATGELALTLNAPTNKDRIEASELSKSGLKNHKAETIISQKAQFTTNGTYHGVPGRYRCEPITAGEACTSTVSSDGNLVLGGGMWYFKPGNPSQKVSDGASVEFGWWAHDLKNTDSTANPVVGVFFGNTGTAVAHSTDIGGTASYSGEALGKYAIHVGQADGNDSGHFKANAELTANFTDDSISGMVKDFTGADGKARDWTVELVQQTINSSGGFEDTTGDDAPRGTGMTIWTIGGTAGKASGEWVGQLYKSATTTADALTPTIAGGAFTSEHGNVGRMVGGFGVEIDD